jgi:hypothetical protein
MSQPTERRRYFEWPDELVRTGREHCTWPETSLPGPERLKVFAGLPVSVSAVTTLAIAGLYVRSRRILTEDYVTAR